MRNSIPHVALIVETSLGYGQGVLRGIADYVLAHQPWSIYVERGLNGSPPSWLEKWNGHGVIMQAQTKRIAQVVAKLKVPAVDTQHQIQGLRVPAVIADDAAVAQAAAEHLLERHFRHFAFVGVEHALWSKMRRDTFVAILRRAGFPCYVYSPISRNRVSANWEEEQTDLAAWLQALPQPVGVMAADDPRALRVLDACRRAAITVPEQIAVIGVDNDETLCNLCDPPLSSVKLNLELIGFTAAELLDHLMQGKTPPEMPIAIKPLGVVTRRSTDSFAIGDPLTAQAMRYIHQHACNGVSVADVARHCNAPRKAIERSFSKLLGISPHRLIMLVKLTRAKELLSGTAFGLDDIANECSLTHAPYLNTLFKKETGLTPGEYRRATQNGRYLPTGKVAATPIHIRRAHSSD